MRSGFITILGRPNVGKSTLLNRIVGQKVAIVTAKPQTTRNRILAIANRPDAQLIFFDTPGIHKPQHEMNRRMVDLALKSMKQVDLALLVADASAPFGPGDAFVLERLKAASVPTVLTINKIDIVKKPDLLPIMETYRTRFDFADIVPCSALDGDGVDLLVDVLSSRLPEGERLYPEETLSDLPERFFVSEIVREKILELTHHEVPYASAVMVDSWEEPEREGESDDDGPAGSLTRIEASILVERVSQRGILVGKKGSMLKAIGTAARKDVEAFLGTRVYLGLYVKVRSDWRENPRVLKELGIDREG